MELPTMTIKLIRAAAIAAAALLTSTLLPSAAQAATHRQFQTINSGSCLRPGNKFQDVERTSAAPFRPPTETR
jgi:hypothetical protein